jgi:uncharacterized membrane protein
VAEQLLEKEALTMAELVVITFDDMEQAEQIRETMRKGQHAGYISLDDSAVVVKDQHGKVHVKNEMDRGVKIGAVGGGLIGLLLGSIFFPLAGILVGAFGGAAVGAATRMGIDKAFVKEVSNAIQPGSSAIFLLVRDANPDIAIAALREYKGTVYQTTLSPEGEENLRRALK